MTDSRAELVQRLRRTVLEGRGVTAPDERQAAAAGTNGDPATRAYIEMIHHAAAEIEDEHVNAVMAAGKSEEEVFELTIAATVGAALDRLEAGLKTANQLEATA